MIKKIIERIKAHRETPYVSTSALQIDYLFPKSSIISNFLLKVLRFILEANEKQGSF